MNVGVLGGTFNPIHFGHLRAAEEVREALRIDRVIFIPAKVPPHKGASGLAPPEVRLELVLKAVAGNPGFEVSDLELRRAGPSYSVDTLSQLRRQLSSGDRLWFLLGADAFREIHTWHRYPELFGLADIAVMRRPPYDSALVPPPEIASDFVPHPMGFRHASGREVTFVPITLLDISSTRIRRALAEGRSVRYLVPEAVQTKLEALRAENPVWFARSQE